MAKQNENEVNKKRSIEVNEKNAGAISLFLDMVHYMSEDQEEK